MKDYVERMIIERGNLFLNIYKLRFRLNLTIESGHERMDMIEQLNIMRSYLQVLDNRIEGTL